MQPPILRKKPRDRFHGVFRSVSQELARNPSTLRAALRLRTCCGCPGGVVVAPTWLEKHIKARTEKHLARNAP